MWQVRKGDLLEGPHFLRCLPLVGRSDTLHKGGELLVGEGERVARSAVACIGTHVTTLIIRVIIGIVNVRGGLGRVVLEASEVHVLVEGLRPDRFQHGLHDRREKFTIIGLVVFPVIDIVPMHRRLREEISTRIPPQLIGGAAASPFDFISIRDVNVALNPLDLEEVGRTRLNLAAKAGSEVHVVPSNGSQVCLQFGTDDVDDGTAIRYDTCWSRRRCHRVQCRHQFRREHRLGVGVDWPVGIPWMIGCIKGAPCRPTSPTILGMDCGSVGEHHYTTLLISSKAVQLARRQVSRARVARQEPRSHRRDRSTAALKVLGLRDHSAVSDTRKTEETIKFGNPLRAGALARHVGAVLVDELEERLAHRVPCRACPHHVTQVSLLAPTKRAGGSANEASFEEAVRGTNTSSDNRLETLIVHLLLIESRVVGVSADGLPDVLVPLDHRRRAPLQVNGSGVNIDGWADAVQVLAFPPSILVLHRLGVYCPGCQLPRNGVRDRLL